MNARNNYSFPIDIASARAATIDADAVVNFATSMATKLHRAAAKGRAGWHDPMQCSVEALQRALQEHVTKGDPVDVGNYAMMLHARGAGTATPNAFNIVLAENMAMRDALRAVLDEVSPGGTPISIDSSLPRSVIDQAARAAAYSFESQEAA